MKHESRMFQFAAVMLFTIAAVTLNAQTTYVAVDLTPSGGASMATGAANGIQVGQAWFDPTTGSNTPRAAVWSGYAGTYTDLTPAGALRASIKGTDGTGQVGFSTGGAALWHGTASSYISLNPAGYLFSIAYGIQGATQVGCGNLPVALHGFGVSGTGPGPDRAIIWNNSASSFVDLQNGSGYDATCALAVANGTQVGHGIKGGVLSAVLWNGTAKSIVTLHPKNYVSSDARATDGTYQVGFATYDVRVPDRVIHHSIAVMWTGTAASAVFLGPAGGFQDSVALGVGSGKQVGYIGSLPGADPAATHAYLWHGTADAGTDLHQYLPAQFVSSQATSIDPVTGVVAGFALTNTLDNNSYHAVIWVPSI